MLGIPQGLEKYEKMCIVLVEVFLNWEFSWEKFCEELLKIYMIKSISPQKPHPPRKVNTCKYLPIGSTSQWCV